MSMKEQLLKAKREIAANHFASRWDDVENYMDSVIYERILSGHYDLELDKFYQP